MKCHCSRRDKKSFFQQNVMCNINNMKNPVLRALLGIKLQQVNNTSYAMK